MAITSGYFNSVNGDRKYNADQMSEYFEGIINEGVCQHIDGGLAVTAGTGLSVNVAAGKAFIGKKWIRNDASLTLTISAASASYARIDAVVLRRNNTTRTCQIVVKSGTPAASPAAPTMTRNSTTYEMALAYVNVAANATSVTVTDKRADTTVCGWATVAESVPGEIDAQLNAMKTGFDGVEYDSPVEMITDSDRRIMESFETIREHTKNLFNPANILNAYITTTGIKSNAGTRLTWIPCEPSTTYTVSKIVGTRFAVAYTSEQPNVSASVSGIQTNYEGSSIKITTGANAAYLVAWVYNAATDTIDEATMLASVQIETGSTATEYTEPYTAIDRYMRDNALKNMKVLPAGTDLNTLYGDIGYYIMGMNNTYDNDPIGPGNRRILICYSYGSGYVHQMVFNATTGDIYQRIRASNTWGAWHNQKGKDQLAEICGSYTDRICTSHAGVYTNSKYQNSPKSFKAARDLGILYQELDVVFTKDLVPVVAHSSFADNAIRIADGDTSQIRFKDFTLAELKSDYVFGDANYTWTIQTLAEAYALMVDLGCRIIVDVGGGYNNPTGSREGLCDYMIANGIQCEALITSEATGDYEHDTFGILCQHGGEHFALGVVVDASESVSDAEAKMTAVINAKNTLNLSKAWCLVRRERMASDGDLYSDVSTLLTAGVKIGGYSYNATTYNLNIPTYFSMVISAAVNINHLRYLDTISE